MRSSTRSIASHNSSGESMHPGKRQPIPISATEVIGVSRTVTPFLDHYGCSRFAAMNTFRLVTELRSKSMAVLEPSRCGWVL